MSFHWSTLVWDSPEPKGAARLCLLALAEYADGNGRCFPSQVTLGRRCTVGERAVRLTLKGLVEGGFITRSPRGRGHQYQIHRARLIAATVNCSEADGRSAEGPTPEGSCRGDRKVLAGRHRKKSSGRPRKPRAAEPSLNHQGEPPTEPAPVGRSGDGGQDLHEAVELVLAHIDVSNETAATTVEEVSEFVLEHGPSLVRQQLGALLRQGGGKPVRPRLLFHAVRNPEKYDFRRAGPGPSAPPKGATVTEKQRDQWIGRGAPARHFFQTTFDEKGLRLYRFMPDGLRASEAAPTIAEVTGTTTDDVVPDNLAQPLLDVLTRIRRAASDGAGGHSDDLLQPYNPPDDER